ncbi:MAG: hypothetical protein AB8F95_15865 [Bacteroidia bacterium]
MSSLTQSDIDTFRKYFGTEIRSISLEDFDKTRKKLLLKYHPDRFENESDVAKELAEDKYKEIEALCLRVKPFIGDEDASMDYGQMDDFMRPDATFEAEGLIVQVITRDKDLKYEMFGTYYRRLEYGDKYPIPGTDAFIRIESDHKGSAIGFNEFIRMYLSFGQGADIQVIIDWLFEKIQHKANGLIINKTRIKIDKIEMGRFIRKTTFLQLSTNH